MGYNIGVIMGKLTVKQANELKDSGVITEETLTSLQKNGIVSTRTKRAERYMVTEKGNWVIPVVYFRGLNGGGYSAKMTELKGKINELIDTYTMTKDEMVKAENTNKKNSKGKNTK
tara:strand:- start:875 stop:1222 length:348 start_codon:yes stop_codon:yes gene_type:complete